MEIKLLIQSEIKSEYKKIVKDAQVIKGAVAYWTWDKHFIEKELGKKYLTALKNKESFFCVDISSPSTNIDNIATCESVVKNFYIFSYKFKNVAQGDEGILSLLHSKITYIKTSENQFIFIGSHNNTKCAFNGFNMEHSILIKFSLEPKDEENILLNSFLYQLDRIKRLCVKFELALIEYYKGMQILDGSFLSRIVLQLDTEELESISIDQTISIITLFDLISQRLNNQKNIKDKRFLVAIYDQSSDKFKLFIALGEADDEVEAGTMDEKVTDSDYIAIRIDGFSDPLGLPYLTFKSVSNKQVKGNALNFTNHLIQRFKLIEEITDTSLILEFKGIRKNIDVFSPLTDEDVEFLKNENYLIDPKSIEKIDLKKHKLTFFKELKINSFSSAKKYNERIEKNMNPELIGKINIQLGQVYELILNRNSSVEENNSEQFKSELLSILSNAFNAGNNLYQKTLGSAQNNPRSVLDEINKTKSKNALAQFEGRFYYHSTNNLS
jgi:hypothetical protein